MTYNVRRTLYLVHCTPYNEITQVILNNLVGVMGAYIIRCDKTDDQIEGMRW